MTESIINCLLNFCKISPNKIFIGVPTEKNTSRFHHSLLISMCLCLILLLLCQLHLLCIHLNAFRSAIASSFSL